MKTRQRKNNPSLKVQNNYNIYDIKEDRGDGASIFFVC